MQSSTYTMSLSKISGNIDHMQRHFKWLAKMWLANGGRGVRSPENNLQFSDLSDIESIDDDSVDPRVQVSFKTH